MTGTTLEKNSIIYEYGQPMTAIHLITSGKVTVSYPGGCYQLGKGDVIGVCELCSEIHLLTYRTDEETNIFTYSFTSIAVLDDLLKNHPDIARLFILSACHQITTLLERCSISELKCSSLHQNLLDHYEKYSLLCSRHRITARTLDNWTELDAYLGEEAPDLWLSEYYMGLSHLYTGVQSNYLVQASAVSVGLLRKCSLDFRRAYTVLEEQFRYLQQLTGYYLNAAGNDLFDFYTSLCYKLGQDCAEINEVTAAINRIITESRDNPAIDASLLEQRVSSFEKNIALMQTPPSDSSTSEADAATLGELAGSLNIILEFAGSDAEFIPSFREHVYAYKQLPDKMATDEECCGLRAAITREFYSLYSIIFERSMETDNVPVPVKMFLYFGYVDEDLAGITNAVYLRSLLDTMSDHSSQGVYTFYDWLTAIYQGKKEPSRDEFEQDYSDYIHKQKATGAITEAELKALENDTMAKVHYELENMFPAANKITYGRISIFCPLFCADNVLKSLDDSYVTASRIAKNIGQIKKIDYSAYFRESFDMENASVMGKESVHFEYVPDIILTPNVGIRGAMWQEIEGKRRNSSGRMLISIFHLEDLYLTLIRLTGDFRWELCKRVQGARWNDISEPSLTSEYFDYIQFYRKNHDLSSEAKERVRTGLQRAKNSFKEMFVRDYIMWIMFEGTGSPRLNKVARKILFTYCPFPLEVRKIMEQNPLYTEIMGPSEVKRAQRLHHINVLIKKLQNSGVRVPESLEQEKAYVEGTISS